MRISLVVIASLLLVLGSCNSAPPTDMQSFRTGTFIIPADEKYDKTTFVRVGDYQIETYNKKVDTLEISWENNFNYTLKMLHPVSDLDHEPIRVRITKVRNQTYEFEAIIGHSNFVQKGTVIKLSD